MCCLRARACARPGWLVWCFWLCFMCVCVCCAGSSRCAYVDMDSAAAAQCNSPRARSTKLLHTEDVTQGVSLPQASSCAALEAYTPSPMEIPHTHSDIHCTPQVAKHVHNYTTQLTAPQTIKHVPRCTVVLQCSTLHLPPHAQNFTTTLTTVAGACDTHTAVLTCCSRVHSPRDCLPAPYSPLCCFSSRFCPCNTWTTWSDNHCRCGTGGWSTRPQTGQRSSLACKFGV